MPQRLLAHLSADFDEHHVELLHELCERLAAKGTWSREAPRWVDEVDGSSCTRPDDQPLRTVGVLLSVSRVGEDRPSPRTDAEQLIDALAAFSREHGVEFELQLDDVFVGVIQDGAPDRLVSEGLLARWEGEP